MPDFDYIPKCFPNDEIGFENLVTETEDLFHVGTINAGGAKDYAKKLMCKGCGGTVFEVAQASYFTAIRCIRCQWELAIHDG